MKKTKLERRRVLTSSFSSSVAMFAPTTLLVSIVTIIVLIIAKVFMNKYFACFQMDAVGAIRLALTALPWAAAALTPAANFGLWEAGTAAAARRSSSLYIILLSEKMIVFFFLLYSIFFKNSSNGICYVIFSSYPWENYTASNWKYTICIHIVQFKVSLPWVLSSSFNNVYPGRKV